MQRDTDTATTQDAAAQAEAAALARRTSPRADLRQSVGWIVFGIVVIVLSWRMDRLERQDINPYTVPGLLPGFLGLAVVFFGALMLVRSWRRLADASAQAPQTAPADRKFEHREARRIWTVIGLCIGYAAGLLGHGLPFWLATAIFVAFAIAALQFAERSARNQRLRGLVFALGMGASTGAVTQFVFQELFLVRLP